MASTRSIKRRKERARVVRKFEDLEHEVAQDPAFKDAHFRRNPPGKPKLSDSLYKLVEPYEKDAHTFLAFQMLIHLGVAAWEIEQLPTQERQKAVDELLSKITDLRPVDIANMQEMIATMIVRKQSLFPNDKRHIISYKLTEQDGMRYLAVVSEPGQE